jgi:hypothetical protein
MTVDIESKHNASSKKAGFTRPFMVGIFDPNDGVEGVYVEYVDEPHLKKRPWQARHYLPGGCVDKAMNYMLQDKFLGYSFYAHNGGNFDHLFWLHWLRLHQDEFGFEIIPVQSSIQIIRVWRNPESPDETVKDAWTFLDSAKLMPMSLAKACKTFGIPGKVEFELNVHESDPRWSVYLEQDCRALAGVLQKFYDMIELKLGGEVGMTAPATSMKLFRKKYLGKGSSPKKVPRYQHWDDCTRIGAKGGPCKGCAHAWIRRGYYGGRTELFEGYGTNLFYYDINSSYVAAMREKMPVDDRYVTSGDIDWRLFPTHAGFAEVSVYIPPDCVLPPLPHRAKRTGKLLFPTGHFHGVWSMEELKLLGHEKVRGQITHIGRVVWFRRKPMFVEMVDELWQLRDKSLATWDEGLDATAKLMGNSLYGKFGMMEDRTTIAFAKDASPDACFLCQAVVEVDAGLCNACEGSKSATGDPDSDVWYQHKRIDAPYIIPHLAAHITALARVRLWAFMQMALAVPGGRVLYTDTDSAVTNVKLPTSSALGALKDEYPGIPLTFLGVQPKVYMLEVPLPGFAEKGKPENEWKTSKVTMKGFPPDLRTKENLEVLIKGSKLTKSERARCDGKDVKGGKENHVWTRLKNKTGKARRCEVCGTLAFTRLQKIRTLARTAFTHPPVMSDVKKSFKSKYDKRIELADGTTVPIVLDEREEKFGEEAAAE